MFQTAKRILSRNGWHKVKRRLQYLYRRRREERLFQKWVAADVLTNQDRENIRREINDFKYQPLISVVMPVYDVEEKWLRRAIESVVNQLYENWEFCIADDCSPASHVRRVLDEYSQKDNRIKTVFRQTNGHISAASNSALELVTGEFVALLDHDDEFAEHALFCVVKEINDFPDVELVYSDEDKIDENNTRRFDPAFKPDWSPDLLYSLNLVTHLAVFRAATLRKINGFREGFEGSQDYDLVLRFYELISDDKIRHIPRILYHWRAIRGSIALGGDQKSYAHERARKAIKEHLEKKGKQLRVIEGFGNLHRVIYRLPDDLPKVSLILNAGDIKNIAETIKNIFAKTKYSNIRILIGLTDSETEKLRREIEVFTGQERLKFIFFKATETSFAARTNKIAQAAEGEILVFLEGNLLPVEDDWLNELAGFAYQKEIGAVGAKLLYPDETIRYSGIVLGINGLIGYAHRGLARESASQMPRAQVAGNFSAVSGACLAIRREVFEAAGGFDAKNFPNGLHDVDLCLRLREMHYRIIFCPYAELIQTQDSITEKLVSIWRKEKVETQETKAFRQRWQAQIENDPFYNPNLSLKNEAFLPALPPRFKKF